MKRLAFGSLMALLVSPFVFATSAVTISGANPSLQPDYRAGTSTTLIYTITNNSIQTVVPINLSGLSGPVNRTLVENDCRNQLLKAPSFCNIGITIAPQAADIGSSFDQTLSIDFRSRKPLTSPIAFSVPSLYAYVANAKTSSISTCDVDVHTGNDTGKLSNCATLDAKTIATPYDVLIQTFNDATYMYVTNSSSDSVTVCRLNNLTGLIDGNCETTGNDFSMPIGMAFYTVDQTTYAYVVNNENKKVTQCIVDLMTGLFIHDSCTDSGADQLFEPNSQMAAYIAFNSANNQPYVYVTGGNGNFGLGQKAITQCKVDQSTGKFISCAQYDIGFSKATGIAFTQSTNPIKAYVASPFEPNVIAQCTINDNNGNLLCSEETIEQGASNATQLTINEITGTSYLYIANGFGLRGSTVNQCELPLPLESYASCVNTSPKEPFDAPAAIAFFKPTSTVSI